MSNVSVDLELSEAEAVALSEFVKRINFEDIKNNAVDETQAYCMRDSLSRLQDALARCGFNPR